MQRDGANLDGIRAGNLVERRGRLASLVINLLPLNSADPIISSSIRRTELCSCASLLHTRSSGVAT